MDDGTRLHRYVGSRAHGDSDIRCGQRRSVVNSIACHRNDVALLAQPLHDFTFLLRQNFGFDFFNPQLFCNGFRWDL